MTTDFLLFNSFDRSGSTLISKVLSEHPDIENLFNPFNATVFRDEFMTVWDLMDEGGDQQAGKVLVEKVLQGDFSEEHIHSRVFFEHSSTLEVAEGKLHVIKTTNFHTKLRWFRTNFPEIKVLGLLRSPIAILASLVRNGFHRDWYGGWAYRDLVKNLPSYRLSEEARSTVTDCLDEVEQMACVIGCLNKEMILDLKDGEIIKYEDVIDDPNGVLNGYLGDFGLSEFDFRPYFTRSVNSSGKSYRGRDVYAEVFSEDQIQRFWQIFEVIGESGYEK